MENQAIKNRAIISMIYMDTMPSGPGPGVMVSTILPISIFDYGNAKVDITGTIIMELMGSTDDRRLQATSVDSVGTGAEMASFDIKVNLHQNFESAKDFVIFAGMSANNGMVSLVLMTAFVYNMIY